MPSIGDIAVAIDGGQIRSATWRKAPTQASTASVWFDLSMSPGNPIPNYYAASPGVAIALARSTDVGLDHGQSVAPLTKYLQRLAVMNVTTALVPCPMTLLDYLMFYPFVDMSVSGAQSLTTNIALPRYPTGAGVQMMAVVVASPVGGAAFNVTYTNSAGVAGRVTPTINCYSGALVNGSIVTSGPTQSGLAGPFIPLQAGDKGVQSVQSVNFTLTDVGLIAMVLVKPLADLNFYDVTAPVEVDYIVNKLNPPVIQDDAYINFICLPQGSVAGSVFLGTIDTIWL